MSDRRAAWVEIQRQRLAHRIWPNAFPDRWTPRTVEQAMADAELRRQHEALCAEQDALDARRAQACRNGKTCQWECPPQYCRYAAR